ncbi:hypothetical protein HXX01_02345 [Candidatus Nomurabacteria bacterium]|nr:hypothetical protein [Candidatus Nomurabacteria bacterium]
MQTNNTKTKEQLCREIVDRMIMEAKAEANAIFQAWKKKFPIEFELSNDNEIEVIKRVLSLEYPKYNKELNIKDIRSAKHERVQVLIRVKDVYDDELNFIKDGYEAHKQIFVDQLFVLKKIEFLKKKVDEYDDEILQTPGEKIDWLGSPSQLAYLILLLMDKTYIEKDGKGAGKKSLRKIGRIIYDTFHIPNLDNTSETTFENFYKELRQNSLSGGAREWVKIIIQR